MDYEVAPWTKVVFWTAVAIVALFLFRDYASSPVEWRPGQVTDKEVERIYHRHSYSSNDTYDSYYIVVNSCGQKGRVSVSRWTYSDWKVGDGCQVAFRHGHYMNYNFMDIRRQ